MPLSTEQLIISRLRKFVKDHSVYHQSVVENLTLEKSIILIQHWYSWSEDKARNWAKKVLPKV